MNQTVRQHNRLVKGNAAIGIKYPMALSRGDLNKAEQRRISCIFWTAVGITYTVICLAIYFVFR